MNGSGACLISGSCLISGELSVSRLIRFDLGGSARAVLHSVHILFHSLWEHGVHVTQLYFCLP